MEPIKLKHFRKLTIILLVFLFVFTSPGFVFAVEEFTTSAGQNDAAEPPVASSDDQAATGDESESASQEELPTEASKNSDISALDSESGDLEYGEERRAADNYLKIDQDSVSGALTFSYGIKIPPGRNGLQPDLELVYNSQSDDNSNIFGYGWSVNIPFIARINRKGSEKLYDENYFYSYLSGELVGNATSSSYYNSKVENGEFLQYQFVNDQYWLVTDKKGTQYKFGYSTSTRQDNIDDPSETYKWMLEEIRDTNGNYIRYEYYKDGGQIYPDKIYYTGHNFSDGIFEIEFSRESRGDKATSTSQGFDVITNYRIDDLDPEEPLTGSLHSRFWYGSSFSVDIYSIKASESSTSTPLSTTTIQDLNYTYDKAGNIIQIDDRSATDAYKTMAYDYDDLYRLTRASSTNATTTDYLETYSYNAIGNIIYKSDIGDYLYAGTGYANPHAVTGLGSGSSSTELLDSAWNLSGNNGSDEEYQSIDSDALNGMESVTITYDLNGLCALGGDASAIIFDQDGWQYISLSDYGTNCYDGEQSVTIPLDDFDDLDPEEPLTGSLHSRFWYGSSFSVDIYSIKANPAGGTGTELSYDNNGNLISDGTWTHAWDYNNRLISSTAGGNAVNYGYDHAGSRVIYAADNSTTTIANKYYEVKNSVITKHVYANDQLIATIEGDDIYYVHTDHLGGSNVITDENGEIAELLDYYPFGGIRLDEKSGSFGEKRKFTGHEHDEDTDLSYMVARYYDGNVGRFISQDPMIQSIGGDLSEYEKSLDELLANPQSLNSYSYTINNPLKYIDPTGETYTEATGGYFVGIGQSLWGTAKGFASSIAHPINTVKGIGTSIANAGNEWKQFASDVTSDPKGTMSQIGEGTQISYNEFMDMPDYEKGKVIGGMTEKAMEVVTVKKLSEGVSKIGSSEGLQVGKYNVKLDTYNKAGGGGLNLRDTTLSSNPYNQRIFGVDYHKFNNNGVTKPRVHYHVGTGSEGAKHKPYQK